MNWWLFFGSWVLGHLLRTKRSNAWEIFEAAYRLDWKYRDWFTSIPAWLSKTKSKWKCMICHMLNHTFRGTASWKIETDQMSSSSWWWQSWLQSYFPHILPLPILLFEQQFWIVFKASEAIWLLQWTIWSDFIFHKWHQTLCSHNSFFLMVWHRRSYLHCF